MVVVCPLGPLLCCFPGALDGPLRVRDAGVDGPLVSSSSRDLLMFLYSTLLPLFSPLRSVLIASAVQYVSHEPSE